MAKIKGIKKVSGESKGLNRRDCQYLQLNYNRRTKEVFTDYHVNLGYNSWTDYRDDDILVVGQILGPMTMAEIVDMVDEALAYDKY